MKHTATHIHVHKRCDDYYLDVLVLLVIKHVVDCLFYVENVNKHNGIRYNMDKAGAVFVLCYETN